MGAVRPLRRQLARLSGRRGRARHRGGARDQRLRHRRAISPTGRWCSSLDEGGERARARDTDGSDRIGGRSDDYHRKVDAAFHIIAAEEPERVRLVDASGAPEEVTQRLLDAIADLLP